MTYEEFEKMTPKERFSYNLEILNHAIINDDGTFQNLLKWDKDFNHWVAVNLYFGYTLVSLFDTRFAILFTAT